MNQKQPPACCPTSPPALVAKPEHVEAFKALAHIDRLRVFFFLVQSCAPVPAKDLQAALDLPGPTLSHHLEALEQAGLIERQRQERFVLSTVRRELVVDLVRLLTACC